MNRRRVSMVVAGALVTLSIAAVALALTHGMAALAADRRSAARTEVQTAAIDAQIAIGRRVAAHLASERSEAAALAGALPPTVDDQGILASVVAAAGSSGAVLADEQRGQPAPAGSGGLVKVPVTIDVNAPAMGPLVQFAGSLQSQPRLLTVSALAFTTAGGDSLHVTASAYSAPLVPRPPPASTSHRPTP